MNIIANGKKIEESLEDLRNPSMVNSAKVLKNMNTHFLQKNEKSGKKLNAQEL